jgi:ribonuclease HI
LARIHQRQKTIKSKHETILIEGLPTGWFDGAAQLDGLNCGVGGHIKITNNSHICWTLNCGPDTNTKAKLLGAWASLLLATRLHILDFQLLGDSKIVIDWLNSKGKLQVSSLLGWMDRTRELQHKFRHITLLHTPRENNKKVDALSKTALQKQARLLSYNHWLENHEGPTIIINFF